MEGVQHAPNLVQGRRCDYVDRREQGGKWQERARDSARRDGKGRPARGLEVLSKMLCFSASCAILSQSKPGHQGPTNCLEETSRAEFS